MEGVTLAAEQAYDLAISEAWHIARFSAMAQAGKLKGLSAYLSKKKGDGKPPPWAGALSFFHGMKAAGVPVEISRVVH